MMMCVTLAPKGLSFKTKRERGSQRMMLCEPERGHRGEEGGEGERGEGGSWTQWWRWCLSWLLLPGGLVT